MEPPKTRIQQKNINLILDTAMDVIAEFGFHGITIDKVAQLSGISRTNIHYYYASRNDLIMATILKVNENWYDAFLEVDPEGEPAEELMKYVRAKLTSSWKHPKFSRVYLAEVLAGAPLTRKYVKTEMRQNFLNACKLVQKWIDEGHIIKVDPAHIFFMIWAMTQYYADHEVPVKLLLGKNKLDEDDYQAALKTISAMIVNGLMVKK